MENELETGNAVSWVTQLRHVANVSSRDCRRVQSAPMMPAALGRMHPGSSYFPRDSEKRENSGNYVL